MREAAVPGAEGGGVTVTMGKHDNTHDCVVKIGTVHCEATVLHVSVYVAEQREGFESPPIVLLVEGLGGQQLTPGQARELAALLTLAADRVPVAARPTK